MNKKNNLELSTGIKFHDFNGLLSFKVCGKKIESFTIGKMQQVESCSDANIPYNVKNITLKIPGVENSSDKFVITKQKKVLFGLSNEKVDAGQSFVPYFDGTDITLDVRSPLTGIGFLHYTKNESYAGYIRPFLNTLHYSDFVFKVENNDPTLKSIRKQVINSAEVTKSSYILCLIATIFAIRHILIETST